MLHVNHCTAALFVPKVQHLPKRNRSMAGWKSQGRDLPVLSSSPFTIDGKIFTLVLLFFHHSNVCMPVLVVKGLVLGIQVMLTHHPPNMRNRPNAVLMLINHCRQWANIRQWANMLIGYILIIRFTFLTACVLLLRSTTSSECL